MWYYMTNGKVNVKNMRIRIVGVGEYNKVKDRHLFLIKNCSSALCNPEYVSI